MLAAGSVITAANGLRGRDTVRTYDLQLVDRLHDITSIETVRTNDENRFTNSLFLLSVS